MRRLVLLAWFVGACSSENSVAPTPAPQLTPAHLVITGGDSQTTPLSMALPQQLRLHLTDSTGRPVPHYPVVIYSTDGASPFVVDDTTDASGDASDSVRVGTIAGLRHFIATLGGALFGHVADTAQVTILPGPVAFIFMEPYPRKAFLNQVIDLTGVLDSAADTYLNRVPVTSVALTGNSPLVVTGLALTSSVESVDTAQFVVNGYPTPILFDFVRDLHELAGAHGFWTCSSDSGSVTATPGLNLLTYAVTFTIDSVAAGPPTEDWTFFRTFTATEVFSDSTVDTIPPTHDYTYAYGQIGASWETDHPLGGRYTKASDSPLTYVEDRLPECGGTWQGTTHNVPATIIK